jgi:hypothetical protein
VLPPLIEDWQPAKLYSAPAPEQSDYSKLLTAKSVWFVSTGAGEKPLRRNTC